ELREAVERAEPRPITDLRTNPATFAAYAQRVPSEAARVALNEAVQIALESAAAARLARPIAAATRAYSRAVSGRTREVFDRLRRNYRVAQREWFSTTNPEVWTMSRRSIQPGRGLLGELISEPVDATARSALLDLNKRAEREIF